MKKRNLIMAFCAIITFCLAVPLGAQTTYTQGDLGGLQSNTNMATAGLFTNDVDDYMSVHDYGDVLKEDSKWFGFVSGKNVAGGALDAGYARYFGSVYFGTWFRGNVFRSSDLVTKTITPVYAANLDYLTQRTDTTTYTEAWNETTNNIEFLIGFNTMGIKVGFFESTSSNKNEGNPNRTVTVVDTLDGIKTYTNAVTEYTNTQSYLKPYMGWGGSFYVAGMKLSPFVNVGFLIYDRTLIDKHSDYTEVGNVKQNVQTDIEIGQKSGHMEPEIDLGAWLDFPKRGSTQTSLGLSYGLNLSLYNNSAEGLGSVKGTVTWGAGYINRETIYSNRTVKGTDMTYYINEQTNISHTIIPAFKVTGEPTENFKLGFVAGIPIIIGFSSSDNYTREITKTTVKYNNGLTGYVQEQETLTYNFNGNSETSMFGVDLYLALGASYQLIPKRFGINAGITASPVGYSQLVIKSLPRTTESITTNKRTEDDGTVTTNAKTVTTKVENDQVLEYSYWQQYTGKLYGGFTFNFNDRAALDLGANSSVGSGDDFNLDLTTVNVIFTFKY